jgi:hypothetical protein
MAPDFFRMLSTAPLRQLRPALSMPETRVLAVKGMTAASCGCSRAMPCLSRTKVMMERPSGVSSPRLA